MKTRFACLCLLALLLPLAACGEIPTPAAGDYPPPQTPLAGVSPRPDRTPAPPLDGVRVVCVDRPLYGGPCTPTPDESEMTAVQSLGLPATIEFDLQRAIHTAQQQGTPEQLVAVYIQFDPNVLTITATVALARQYGMEVESQFGNYHYINGSIALDAIAQLAAEKGISNVGLTRGTSLDGPYDCPPPGRPTPVPVTCSPP